MEGSFPPRNRWLRASRFFAGLMIASIAIFMVSSLFYLTLGGEGPPENIPPNPGPPVALAPPSTFNAAGITLAISLGTFLVSAIGTGSTVLLSWRNEKRQSAEFQLRIQQLEAQVTQLTKEK